MRLPQTLALHLGREVMLYTALGFLAAFPTVLVPNLMQRVDQFLVPGIALADVLEIFGWVTPLVAAYALPIAFLFGGLMALGRLTAYGELTAMRSSGLGPGALAASLLGAGAVVSLISAGIVLGLEPRAQRELTRLSLELAARGGLIEAGRFQRLGDRVIFVRRRAGPGRLEGVMISDRSTRARPFLVFAEAAEIRFDADRGTLHLLLERGDIRMQARPGEGFEGHRLSFARLDYAFPERRLSLDHWRYWPNQLDVGELRRTIASAEAGDPLEHLVYREARVYRAQLHRLYAVPLAPLLFALLGVSLGLGDRVRGRARGFLLALALLVAYYALFVFGQGAAYAGRLPAALGVWAPNAALLATGLLLLRRAWR